MIKKYHIVSPREPSGATWLINCFLYLGVITYRTRKENMWHKLENGEYKLTENEQILKKWLPFLSEQETFKFRENIEIEWSHKWPTQNFENSKIIYFVRDPRDAIYSRYKRESLPISFDDFIQLPDPSYLLDKIDYWKYFNKLWLTHPDLKVFKFESYREDAVKTLKDILRWIDLDFSEAEILEAVSVSTSENAAKAEAKLARVEGANRHQAQVMNQGGIVGRWKGNIDETKSFIRELEKRCEDELKTFGYLDNSSSPVSTPSEIKLPLQFQNLNVFSGVTPFKGISSSFESCPTSKRSADYIFNKSGHWLTKTGLENFELKRLSSSTELFLKNDLTSRKNKLANSIPNISLFNVSQILWDCWKILNFKIRRKIHSGLRLIQVVGLQWLP